MSESKYTSFPETGLPMRFKKAFDLAREAHLLVDNDTADFAQFWHFHPVKMAEEAMAAKLDDHAVMAAILHDVVDSTPMTMDHVERAVDWEVASLLYEISWPMALQFDVDGALQSEYVDHLLKASAPAQSVKLLGLIQTLIHLGTKKHALAVHYANAVKPLIEVLHPQGSPLKTRALYICKWASRVLYERQVNHYGLVPASAEML